MASSLERAEQRLMLQRKALRVFSQIRDMLSADQEQLFSTFQEFDPLLSGRIDCSEFRRMLQTFDPSINVKAMEAFVSEVAHSPQDDCITFTEFLDWWELQKVDKMGAANDLWFMTQLKARFAAQVAKEIWGSLRGDVEIEKRLDQLTLSELTTTVKNYRADLFQLRLWMHDARTRNEEQLEGQLMQQAEMVRWTPEESEDLADLFRRVAGGEGTLDVATQLPELCALLQCDITHSCIERTMKLYAPEMTFAVFLVFWACRPESGKLKTGRAPVWRWGSKKPTGTDVPQPGLF